MTGLVVVYRMAFGCVYAPLTSVVLNTLPKRRLSHGFWVEWTSLWI
jgi:hypothetical protein